MRFEIDHANLHNGANNTIKGPTQIENVALAQAIEDGIMDSGNYVSVFTHGQGKWKPLTPRYVARKARSGYSSKTWMLTGNSFDALTTPIIISGRKQSNFYGRDLVVKSLSQTTLLATIQYVMTKPTSMGWPKRPSKRSWFAKNEAIRPFLREITPAAEARVFDNMIDVVIRYFTRLWG